MNKKLIHIVSYLKCAFLRMHIDIVFYLLQLKLCSILEVNVLHIAKTNIYDGAANVSVALDIMKKQYSGSTWHYTDPISGQKPDLHHALLYRTPKGGYATVGGVCDSRIGYGVSGGVQGTLANIGTVYWWVMKVDRCSYLYVLKR